jgi:hypothetical protein
MHPLDASGSASRRVSSEDLAPDRRRVFIITAGAAEQKEGINVRQNANENILMRSIDQLKTGKALKTGTGRINSKCEVFCYGNQRFRAARIKSNNPTKVVYDIYLPLTTI